MRFFEEILSGDFLKKSRQQKARYLSGLLAVTWRSVFQVTKYGAADGTRTRDPRRDRPVF
jgi:hypothetical protein